MKSRRIPTKSFPKLFHVGTMNHADKRRGSYEGSGLSVSLHPEAWTAIARLGHQVWTCERPNNRFVDFLELSEAQHRLIANWAIDAGLATRGSVWRVDYVDDETDERRWITMTNRTEAQEEAAALREVAIEVPNTLIAAPELLARMMQDRSEPSNAADLTTIAYAEDVLQIDGVWWNERLDILGLSAPRAVIVPSAIPRWTFTPRQQTGFPTRRRRETSLSNTRETQGATDGKD
jgi:hypothetical protein